MTRWLDTRPRRVSFATPERGPSTPRSASPSPPSTSRLFSSLPQGDPEKQLQAVVDAAPMSDGPQRRPRLPPRGHLDQGRAKRSRGPGSPSVTGNADADGQSSMTSSPDGGDDRLWPRRNRLPEHASRLAFRIRPRLGTSGSARCGRSEGRWLLDEPARSGVLSTVSWGRRWISSAGAWPWSGPRAREAPAPSLRSRSRSRASSCQMASRSGPACVFARRGARWLRGAAALRPSRLSPLPGRSDFSEVAPPPRCDKAVSSRVRHGSPARACRGCAGDWGESEDGDPETCEGRQDSDWAGGGFDSLGRDVLPTIGRPAGDAFGGLARARE